MQGNRKQNERNKKTKARPYFFFERTRHTFIDYKDDTQLFLGIAKELYESMSIFYVYYCYVLHVYVNNMKVRDDEKTGYRGFTEFIVWSTLPHYLAVAFVICPNDYLRLSYAIVMLINTTFSMLWHILREPENWIMYVDYILATIWTIMDIVIVIFRSCPFVLVIVLVLNILVLTTNIITDALGRMGSVDYAVIHAYWHLFSAFKTIGISYLRIVTSIVIHVHKFIVYTVH